jgi:WD repeat-containing protein 68
VLVEDEYSEYPDFTMLCDTHTGYPQTSLQWQPASANNFAWSQKPVNSELLATTAEVLRIWELTTDGSAGASSYVGRQSNNTGYSLTLKRALSGYSKVQSSSAGTAPLTNFSWNEKQPSLIVTSSIDTTCTVWNIDTCSAITQLIAHDREVYDVAWLPDSTDIFVSVGADGSLRAFDLRSLEHSTILYETPPPKNVVPPPSPNPSARPPTSPLLRIAFNPLDSNYMSTFHMDGSEVQILDMRSPGQPVMELKGHCGPLTGLAWSRAEHPLLATAGDDCQALLWDLTTHMQTGVSPLNTGSRLNSPRPDVKKRVVTEPVMAYTAGGFITNLAWSPQMPSMTLNTGMPTASGEWLAIVSGQSIRALKV